MPSTTPPEDSRVLATVQVDVLEVARDLGVDLSALTEAIETAALNQFTEGR